MKSWRLRALEIFSLTERRDVLHTVCLIPLTRFSDLTGTSLCGREECNLSPCAEVENGERDGVRERERERCGVVKFSIRLKDSQWRSLISTPLWGRCLRTCLIIITVIRQSRIKGEGSDFVVNFFEVHKYKKIQLVFLLLSLRKEEE